MNHWGIGWIDWNLVLDKEGGPNWIRNYVDAPIIVNPETDEFFKQPMYYALKHFSRFVERGSVRIAIDNHLSSVSSTAFVTPSNEVVVVLYNRYVYFTINYEITVRSSATGSYTLITMFRDVKTFIRSFILKYFFIKFILLCRSNREENIVLDDPNNGPVCLTLLPYSINTIIYAQ